MEGLTNFLQNAISDFIDHSAGQTPGEWLKNYLGESISSKSAEEIAEYSDNIIESVDFIEHEQAEMNAAAERGISAENWAAMTLTQNVPSTGETAKEAAIMLNDLNAAQDVEADVIDIEGEDWSDGKWNEYKLKDTVKGVAAEAGLAGLREIGSEMFAKAANEGIESLTDKEYLTGIAVSGAQTGLKVAVSAGLAVAEERGIIPEIGVGGITAIAHRTIESASALVDVARGKRTMSEALTHIKNTAVAAFTGIWMRNKHLIAEAAGQAYPVVGPAVVGAVTGLITPQKDESRLKTVIKEAGKAVVGFLTKERYIPSFCCIKEKVINFLFG